MLYFKYIITFVTIFFLCGCLSIKSIQQTYQKGNEAWRKKYENDKENTAIVNLHEDVEIAENEKIESLLTQTIKSLNVSLEDLIIINYHSGNEVEYYYLFPKETNEYYYFYNFLWQPTELKIYKEFKDSSKEHLIIAVFNYFNSSEFLEKRLNINFCVLDSSSSLNVLKIENNNVKLFYLNPFDMCENNNVYYTLEGDKIALWKFAPSSEQNETKVERKKDSKQ